MITPLPTLELALDDPRPDTPLASAQPAPAFDGGTSPASVPSSSGDTHLSPFLPSTSPNNRSFPFSASPDTHLASAATSAQPAPAPAFDGAASPGSTISSDSNESHLSPFLLPLPTSPNNRSQSSFSFSDGLDSLPAEIASADISIAPDGSFVETSSGPAARELKRRYDQHAGVGKSVRSPYAITAFVNQHGKPMFRVGHREMSAPAASAVEVEQRVSSQSISGPSSSSSRAKRRSRMSMHALLPPSMFKNGTKSPPPLPAGAAGGPRKLRKTRSIPDMSATASRASEEPGTSTLTGRAHSHSVTAADMPRYSRTEVPRGDVFGDVMNWLAPSSASTSSSVSLLTPDAAADGSFIRSPFGAGVAFDSPSKGPTIDHLPPPRLLREMQSFESGLTARQDAPVPDSLLLEAAPPRPPSAVRIRVSTPSLAGTPEPPPLPPPVLHPAPATAVHSRYSPDVFDVLQNYRGLPRLDKLSPGAEETTVIRLSLAADATAAPRDDPRFVIWGEVRVAGDDDASARGASVARKRSVRTRGARVDPPAAAGEGETRKVLVAATIERWIAQLTSDLNYDELLNFFLTYRTYIGAVDLWHLLICRFHWALMPHASAHDEMVRRIVRVRTFVAIRYWLLTFFTVDFMPNRELRLLVANWLNTLLRDPILKQHQDGLAIVKKLIKVVKDCKKAHTRSKTKPKARTAATQPPLISEQLLGEKFAEATRKAMPDDEDSDVDLDFLPDEGVPAGVHSADPVNAHLSAAHIGAGLAAAQTSIPPSSLSILQQTGGVGAGAVLGDAPFVQTPATLPIHHNALSRALVKTMGRLGRWKRVLNSRAGAGRANTSNYDDAGFDLELTATGELLAVNGGVEQYLKMLKAPAPPESPTPERASVDSAQSAEESVLVSEESMLASEESAPVSEESSLLSDELPRHGPLGGNSATTSEASPRAVPIDVTLADGDTDPSPSLGGDAPPSSGESSRSFSMHSSSTDSLGLPLAPHNANRDFPLEQTQFDIVSIDELDFSDTSSDSNGPAPAAPPGLRRVPRKLPLRRDFEFVRRSESVSSMAPSSRDSRASEQSSSAVSASSGAGLGGNIRQWHLNALVDSLSNDDESGDVEAALRRLEGEINPQRQREKASKVDGWVRTIQQRTAAQDYSDEEPRFASDDEDGSVDYQSPDDGGSEADGADDIVSRSSHDGVLVDQAAPQALSVDSSTDLVSMEQISTPVATQNQSFQSASGPGSPARAVDAKPAPEDAVPLEILQSRVPSRPSTSHSKKFGGSDTGRRQYRSFIMQYRADSLVEQFSMIDRDLFMGVKFEELVLDDWMSCEEVNVLDWAQFLKDRARWRAEALYPQKTTALAAVRARFNLIANFTITEVVLTPLSERAVVTAKLIRIAWKAYNLGNYNLLVAIMSGLKSDFASKALRRVWNKVGSFEMRIYKDLEDYTTNVDDFRFVRSAVEAMIEVKPLDSHPPSVSSGAEGQSGKGRSASDAKLPVPSACIPFIGVYLSQLFRYSRLPDLIDPTAPNEAVVVDPVTGNFATPARPEVFSALAPLPPSMQLEPLINVHKQRLIASVIKSLVAGQHLASRVHYPIDKRLFQKCLKLRGLDAEALKRATDLYPD